MQAYLRSPVWTLEPTLRIGGAGGPAEFDAVWDVIADRTGRIYVLLTRQKEVRVFDRNGRFLKTIGRSGSGPGEFRAPTRLAIDPTGRLWVTDDSRHLYVIFDSSGQLTKEFPKAQGMQCRPDPCGWIFPDGTHIDGSFQPMPPSIFSTRLFAVDSMGQVAQRLVLPVVDTTPNTSAIVPFGRRTLYAPASRNSVWVGSSAEYRLALVTISGDSMTIVHGYAEAMPTTAADREAFESNVRDLAQGASVAGGAATFPKTKPPISKLTVASDLALWVAKAGCVDGQVDWFDVINPDGSLRARVRVKFKGSVDPLSAPPLNPSPIRVIGDDVYMVETDADGVPYVIRARVKRSG